MNTVDLPVQLPAITQADLRRAWLSLNPRGVPCPFEEALKVDMYRRLIECRAKHTRTQQWLASLPPSTQQVRRVRLDAQGNVASWCIQTVMGPRRPSPQLELLTTTEKTSP